MLLSIIAGILTGMAFTNPVFFPVVYFSLAPFIGMLLKAKTLKSAVFASVAFALPFFGVVLWWLNELQAYMAPFAGVAFAALVVYETLIFTGFGVTIFYLKRFKFMPGIFVIPATYVLFEYLRSLGPYGITAGGLGYTQSAFLAMIQIAKFTGVYGVTFWLVLINYLLLLILMLPRHKFTKMILLVAIIAANFIFGNHLINRYDQTLPKDGLKIAVIQGNIPQKQKLKVRNNYLYFNAYRKLSLKAHLFRPKLYIWPETALNNFIENQPVYGKIKTLATELNAGLLLGAPRYQGGRYYNSAFYFNNRGSFSGKYDKKILVPFGEYLPLRKLLYPLLAKTKLYEADYSPGSGKNILLVSGNKAGMLICFESTFPKVSRKRINRGADFLITLTNDAWFNKSIALWQHLQSGIFRAVENGVYFVQAANTGVSAVVDGVGRIKTKSKVNRATVLIAVIKQNPAKTFYAKNGDVFVLACGGFIVLLFVGYFIFKEKDVLSLEKPSK